jgi:hypothetical protein
MSVFKNSFSVAANVIPSDDVNIPFPNNVLSGTNTSVVPNTRLIDSTANFVTSGIKVGDTVLCNDDGVYAYVVAVFETYLILSNNIFASAGQSYSIFQGENNGCYIYVGDTTTGSNLEVETIGGNVLIFYGVLEGQVLPVQVRKVLTTSTASKLIALW